MRYFTTACPEFSRVLLVESGSRSVLNIAIPRLKRILGEPISFGLVTCHAGLPAALESSATVWRTQDYDSREARSRLARDCISERFTVVAILCSNEPIMTRWKWWLAWTLPAKVLIVNENADCFWLDTGSLSPIRKMVSVRFGLSGRFASRTLLRIAMLPFSFVYLLLFAATIHAHRAWRLRSTGKLKL